MVIRDTFTDTAKTLTNQTRAGFSIRDTSLSIAGTLPTVLNELGHNVPGLGTLLAGSFLTDEFERLNSLAREIDRVKKAHFELSRVRTSTLTDASLYVIHQLTRRHQKLRISIVGRTLQAVGSSLTLASLFTAGATAVPGLAIGLGGTAIRGTVSARSVFNYIRKSATKQLSVEREQHARLLYGLTLLHVERIYSYETNWSDHKEAKRCIEIIRSGFRANSYELHIGHQLVSQLAGLEFLKNPWQHHGAIEHFLEYGLWSIMNAIKS